MNKALIEILDKFNDDLRSVKQYLIEQDTSYAAPDLKEYALMCIEEEWLEYIELIADLKREIQE